MLNSLPGFQAEKNCCRKSSGFFEQGFIKKDNLCSFMYYMAAFWILILAIFIFDHFIKKRISEATFRNGIMWLVSLTIGFLVVGIITKDPVFSFWGVPPEFEWVVGVVLGVLVVWKYLYNPLQDRVIGLEKNIVGLEKDMVEVKSDLRAKDFRFGIIESDLAMIKRKILKA